MFHSPVRKSGTHPGYSTASTIPKKCYQKNVNHSKWACSCVWSTQTKITCKVVSIYSILLPLFARLVWNLSNFSLGEGVDQEYSCLGHHRPWGDPLSPSADAQGNQHFILKCLGLWIQTFMALVKTLSAGYDFIPFCSLWF